MGLYKLLDWKMASVEASKLSKAEHDELCCSYAALMLHDDGLEITAEKLNKVIKASGNIGDLLTNIASAAPGGGGGAAGPVADAPEEKAEEKKEEVEEAVDMGGLFGDEEEY